jgi:hypothetical protein
MSVADSSTNLVNRFLMSIEVIPEHCGVFQIRLRISFLGMDQEEEERRVPNEEDRRVIENPV